MTGIILSQRIESEISEVKHIKNIYSLYYSEKKLYERNAY